MSASFEESLNYFSEYKELDTYKNVSVADNVSFMELTSGLHRGTLSVVGGGEATYTVLSATRAAFDICNVVECHNATISQLGDSYVVSNLSGVQGVLTECVDVLIDGLEAGEEYHMFTDLVGIKSPGAAEIHILDGTSYDQLTYAKTGLWVNATTDVAGTEVMFNAVSTSVVLRIYPYYSQPFIFKDIYFNLPYLGSTRTAIHAETKTFNGNMSNVYAPKPSYITISAPCNITDSYADARPEVAPGIYNVRLRSRNNAIHGCMYLDTRNGVSTVTTCNITSVADHRLCLTYVPVRLQYVLGALRLQVLTNSGKFEELAPLDYAGKIELQCLVEF